MHYLSQAAITSEIVHIDTTLLNWVTIYTEKLWGSVGQRQS